MSWGSCGGPSGCGGLAVPFSGRRFATRCGNLATLTSDILSSANVLNRSIDQRPPQAVGQRMAQLAKGEVNGACRGQFQRSAVSWPSEGRSQPVNLFRGDWGGAHARQNLHPFHKIEGVVGLRIRRAELALDA